MNSDLTISGAALAVFTALLGSVTSALCFVFFRLLKTLEEDRDYWRQQAMRLADPLDRATKLAEENVLERKRGR